MPEPKSTTTLVTSENRAEFMAGKLGLDLPTKIEAAVQDDQSPQEVKTEVKSEEPKTEEAKVEEKKKGKLNERMSELTEARKKAEAKAEAAEAKAAAAETARLEAEAKLAPPKAKEAEAAPQRAQFSSDDDYNQAMIDFRVDQRLAERDKEAAEEREKAAQTARARSWDEHMAETEKEIPDFKAKLDASPVRLTRELAQAVLDTGRTGPRILLHFAENKADAERIMGLTVGGMLREIGKLEARLEPKKKDTVTVEKEAKVEISQAPPPINPLKGNGSGGGPEKVDSAGVFHGTFAEWKVARKAGKIK